MKLPIQYAITYPERVKSDFPRLDLAKLDKLTFFKPDYEKFECLKLAFDVISEGGSYPVVLNAANEAAVDMFLKNEIKFLDIPALIKKLWIVIILTAILNWKQSLKLINGQGILFTGRLL
jgi:1-deoxy-D-xylulose-5-phosphate reductoisomerase